MFQVFIRLHIAEIFHNHINRVIGIEIARQRYSHIVRHIPFFVVFLDIGYRRVLQMGLRPQHGLCAIWMRGEQCCKHGLVRLASVVGKRHVLLLIDGFQLGVETAKNGILEAVRLHDGPAFQFIRGNILDVAGNILRCIGISPVGSDSRHHLVILVRYGKFRSFETDRIDFMIERGTRH